MISSKQMRAARALLGWKQSDIAKSSGLSLTAINAIETGSAAPRISSIALIQKAYEEHGVEFLPGDGLRLKSETFNIQTLEGPDIVFKLLEDAIEHARRTKTATKWFGVSEDAVARKYRQAHFAYYLELQKLGIKEQSLCSDKQKHFYAPSSTTQYRTMPHEFMGSMDYAICGIKLYLGSIGKKYRLIIIEHEGLAEAYRQQYDAFWKIAKPLHNYKAGFDADFEKYKNTR